MRVYTIWFTGSGLLFQSFCSKYRRADSSVGNLSNSSNVLAYILNKNFGTTNLNVHRVLSNTKLPKLYINATKNLIELKLYMNPTKMLIELKLCMNPTKNLRTETLHKPH